MSKTPLLRSLRQLVRDVRNSKKSGVPVSEIQDIRAERKGLTRRGVLFGAAAGAGLLAIPRRARATGSPSITVVGGGIAGLTCALTLADAGFASTVYEAGGRVGGRMFTNRTNYFGGQITEWGGELIDTGHTTVRNLAKRFGLPLDNLLATQPNHSRDVFRVDNQYYSAAQADADFLAMTDALYDDLVAAGYPTTFDAYTAQGQALDQMTIRQWIDTRVPGGSTSKLGQVLDAAYNIEFGADVENQSALNLLYLLGYQPTGSRLDMFGESDEKYHIRGGNQQLPEAIADDLGPDVVKTGYTLVKLAETPNGRYRATFARAGSTTVDVVSDYVVLAMPFTVLKNIDTTQAGFDARKKRAIANLGGGHNGKLQLQFNERKWLGTGAWPGVANGSSYTDTYQVSWDVTRAQAGTSGILVLYSGGSVTDSMKSTSPFSTAADSKVLQDAQKGFGQITQTFPGLAWNGKATQSLMHKNPNANLAYSFYKPGQYTDFGGYEGHEQGGVYFCGEHCTQDFQGFMEGGAITGKDTAEKLIEKLG